jgi:hypothetical protein
MDESIIAFEYQLSKERELIHGVTMPKISHLPVSKKELSEQLRDTYGHRHSQRITASESQPVISWVWGFNPNQLGAN